MANATKTTPEILTTKHVAKKFGVEPVMLRRVLRSMPEYADGVHTNYRWQGWQDKAISKIAEAIKRGKTQQPTARTLAQAALSKAAKTSKPAAKPKASKTTIIAPSVAAIDMLDQGMTPEQMAHVTA